MGAIQIVGGIVLLLVCVVIIAVVTIQEPPKQGGLNALTGGDSFLSQNQGRTKDEMLRKLTRACAFILFIVTIVLFAIVTRQG